MTASSYLAPAPRQLDIIDDTPLSRSETRTDLSIIVGGKSRTDLSTCPKTKARTDLSTVPTPESRTDLSTRMRRVAKRRADHKISVQALLAQAGVNRDAYFLALKGASKTRQSTVEKLEAALNRLAAGAGDDERRTLCQATLRLVTAQLARNAGWDPVLMLSQDFTHERVNDPVWRQASRLRRCAIYLLAEGLGIKKAAIGHAIGMSRAGAQKAVAEIEAERDRSEEFDRLMQEMMVQLKGDM